MRGPAFFACADNYLPTRLVAESGGQRLPTLHVDLYACSGPSFCLAAGRGAPQQAANVIKGTAGPVALPAPEALPSDVIVADDLWLLQTLSQPFFERSDTDLNHLTRLNHCVCAVVQGTTQFDSKLAVLSDALHQGVDETGQRCAAADSDQCCSRTTNRSSWSSHCWLKFQPPRTLPPRSLLNLLQ
jgi:hypothetical protein